MTPSQIQHFLAQVFKRHGVELLAHEDWLLQGGTFPAIRAVWHERPEGRSGRLDVQIVAGPGRLIEESFAGVGGGEAGCKDALQQFVINDLYVLLAAFWDRPRPEEVTIEHWEIAGREWTAYIGNFGLRAAVDEPIPLPDNAFVAVEAVLKQAELPQHLHWVRLFYGNIGTGNTVAEALLDNQPWPEAESAFAALAWPPRDHYYSARNFLILKAKDAPDFGEMPEADEQSL